MHPLHDKREAYNPHIQGASGRRRHLSCQDASVGFLALARSGGRGVIGVLEGLPPRHLLVQVHLRQSFSVCFIFRSVAHSPCHHSP